MNDLIGLERRFEISVFGLLRIGSSQRVDEPVERGEVATIGTLDSVLDAVIAWDQDRIGGVHVGEVRGGVSLATPCVEPRGESLTAATHRRDPFGGFSAGDTREVTKEEREIYLFRGQ